jgi:hypothetical protein
LLAEIVCHPTQAMLAFRLTATPNLPSRYGFSQKKTQSENLQAQTPQANEGESP